MTVLRLDDDMRRAVKVESRAFPEIIGCHFLLPAQPRLEKTAVGGLRWSWIPVGALGAYPPAPRIQGL